MKSKLAPPKPTPTRVRELFLEALDLGDAGERAAFLDAQCGGDTSLQSRVEELLRERAAVGSFLETPAISGARRREDEKGAALGPHGTSITAPVTEKSGDRIGPYKLLQQIGEGGCGVVYMAEQEKPVRRRVALKVIKLGMDTRNVIARFEAERQALAMMDHPNIAKVLDAGATETGRPYFVMELVRGIRITEYCDENNLDTEERLHLFIQVAQAIQHAHQKGIIHRDIKPSNILVTLHDAKPVPKVIDFGIAKAMPAMAALTDKTLFTEFQTFIGTPVYMSPEQAVMSGLDIDTRSDIYALGVLLYELLVGKTPFDAETLYQAGLDECRRTIREVEPSSPSTRLAAMVKDELTSTAQRRRTEALRLIHLLRGDLDWIVMKCLEKDRTRRYETASGLAADVQRFLDSEPVLARPPSNIYRLRKLLRRHSGAFAAVTGLAATLIAGATISTWQAIRATRAERDAHAAQILEAGLRQEAEREKASALLNEYVADINLTHQSIADGNYGRAIQLTKKHLPEPGESDLRGFEWRYLWALCQGDEHVPLPTQDGNIQALAVSPDAHVLAIGLREQVVLMDLRSHAVLGTIPKAGNSLAFLPDGNALLTASRSTARVWRTTDWTEIQSLPGNFSPFALSEDGARLVTTSRQGVRLWDTLTWTESRLLPGVFGPLAFSPDGSTLAADGREGITLWSADDRRKDAVLRDSDRMFFAQGGGFRGASVLAFSRDGRHVVAPRNSVSERGVFVISVWDATSGEEVAVLPDDAQRVEHTGAISALEFSPDGNLLASASWDHSIRLWDFHTRQLLTTLQGHLNEVWAMAFFPDGKHIVTGAKDGGLNLWSVRPKPEENHIAGDWKPIAFSRDSRSLAAVNAQGTVAFLNLATREPEKQFQLEGRRFWFMPSVAISDDFKTMVQGRSDGRVKIWNTDTLESTTLDTSESRVDFVELSPNGQVLITGGRNRALNWWNLSDTSKPALNLEARRVLFSGDGRTLAALQRDSAVQLWDVPSQSLRASLDLDPSPGFTVALSFDGRVLAAAGGRDDFDNSIRLWDTATGELLGTCTGHKQSVWSIAFSPDGRTLATSSDDSTLKLWNVATQQELLSARHLGTTLTGLLFSHDGQMLVGASSPFFRAGELRIFRAPIPHLAQSR